jgi:hypothetical protein
VKTCIPLCQNAIGNARGSNNEIEGNEHFSFQRDETSYSECPYAYSKNPQKYDDSKLKNIKGESDNESIRSRSYTSSTSTESSLISRTSERRSGNSLQGMHNLFDSFRLSDVSLSSLCFKSNNITNNTLIKETKTTKVKICMHIIKQTR